MSQYHELSAYQRDVLEAVAVSEQPVAGGTIKLRVSDIRQDPPTAYVYTVLSTLVEDGWLTRSDDADDNRVDRYRLTEQAQTALERRFELLAEEVCESLDRSPPDKPSRLRSDGGQTVDDSLTATLAVLVDDETVTLSTDSTAELRLRDDHGQIRLEATDQTDRTVEAVLEGSPDTMTALADRIYEVAATAASRADGGLTDG